MDIIIREGILTPEILNSLRSVCAMPELEPDLLERAINSSLFTLCAVSGTRVVGTVRVVGDGAFVFIIYDLLVVPLWRRRGIGSMLVKEAIGRSKSLVPPGRAVVVSLFSVEGREGFYSRIGFTELPAPGLGAGMQHICL